MSDQHPSPPSRQARSALLPWVLAAIALGLSVGLMVVVATQNAELDRLRGSVATTPLTIPSAAASGTPAPSQAPAGASVSAPASAATTPDPQFLAMLDGLPRRDKADPAALGSVDAKVVLIEWSDFRCPFCAKWATTTHKDLLPYVESGSLRLEHRDRVLFGEESQLAAQATRAAGQQGRYWQFYEALFASAPLDGHLSVTRASVTAAAKKAGVPDLARFTSDLTNPELTKLIAADDAEATQLGVDSTPTFVINRSVLSGAQPTEQFIELVESYGAFK